MDDETRYKNGFNQGYVLAGHAPALMEALKPALDQSNNDYLRAIVQGADQYQKDKSLEKDKEVSKDAAIQKENKAPDIDMYKE